MTPAERRAKLEAAKALMQEVEADDTSSAAPDPAAPTPAVAPNAPADPAAPAAPAPAPAAAPAALTGPGGDTRVSGQPGLLQTMKIVWQAMKAASTPKVTGSKIPEAAKTAVKVATTVAKVVK